MATWIVPFRGRGRSMQVDVNFLWNHDRIYVSDNHRVALWCWQRHIHERTEWRLLHIDFHNDCGADAQGRQAEAAALLPTTTTIDAFTSAAYDAKPGRRFEYFRYDNYIPIFWIAHSEMVKESWFATAEPRSPDSNTGPVSRLSPFELPEWIERRSGQSGDKRNQSWIVNLDIDYFWMLDRGRSKFHRILDDAYVDRLSVALLEGYQSGWIRVLTIALSPETAGSWREAEQLLARLLAPFPEMPILPPTP